MRPAEIGQSADDSHGFQADGDDLADEALYILLIVGPIGIVDDAAALIACLPRAYALGYRYAAPFGGSGRVSALPTSRVKNPTQAKPARVGHPTISAGG